VSLWLVRSADPDNKGYGGLLYRVARHYFCVCMAASTTKRCARQAVVDTSVLACKRHLTVWRRWGP
jgi:hypothetical protein